MTVRELIKSLKFAKRRIGNVEVFVAGCDHNGDFLKCSLSDNGIACNADSVTIDVLMQSIALKGKQYSGASTKEEKFNALLECCNDHFHENCYGCNIERALWCCGPMAFMRMSDKEIDVLYAKICGDEASKLIGDDE